MRLGATHPAPTVSWSRSLIAIFLFVGCGADPWTQRLQERMGQAPEEHPWMVRAKQTQSRALDAREQGREEVAATWAQAADRFVTAALVATRNDSLENSLKEEQEKADSLKAELTALEAASNARHTVLRNAARRGEVTQMAWRAYDAAEEYESRFFWRRNKRHTELLAARAAIVRRARTFIASILALNPAHIHNAHEQEIKRCLAMDKSLAGLDCANRVSWDLEQLFFEQQRSTGLSQIDTGRLVERLQAARLSPSWENHTLAIPIDRTHVEAIARELQNTQGPVQLQGRDEDAAKLRRLLIRAGTPANRIVPRVSGSAATRLRLLAYPMPPPVQDK